MLTRLRVAGFKNLVDVDVRFGPFTCVAGPNGVGKSNLFDAIAFLHFLAERPLSEAALSVRGEGSRAADVRSLFHRVGADFAPRMMLSAEMVVPPLGRDDLGQPAEASITFLRYTVEFAHRDRDGNGAGGLELVKEELVHINLGDAKREILFPHSTDWSKLAVRGRRASPFISTETNDDGQSIVKLHQEGKQGRARSLLAADLPRTVLSATNAAESPTVVVARQEMRSWRLLQLEPSSMRRPDEFASPTTLGTDGSHLPATLFRLAHTNGVAADISGAEREARVYAQVANRLTELIDDVRQVRVDRDLTRELLTLQVSGRDGTIHAARDLSDGTLRFLGLAILELDPEAQGVLCLEEPENGIHPTRIPTILLLLQDIAVDVQEPVGLDNPLRQVIINTHSPAVVGQVPDDSLLVAAPLDYVNEVRRYTAVQFSALPDTWRAKSEPPPYLVARGDLLAYLSSIAGNQEPLEEESGQLPTRRRVVDRSDLQPLLPGIPSS